LYLAALTHRFCNNHHPKPNRASTNLVWQHHPRAHNDTIFRKPYDPTQPIETFYSQIEDAMDYADAGKSAYTAAQVVTNAYLLIFTTGMLFHKSCRK
jgi:hypothetical protein